MRVKEASGKPVELVFTPIYDKVGNVVQMGPYQVRVTHQTYLPIVMR